MSGSKTCASLRDEPFLVARRIDDPYLFHPIPAMAVGQIEVSENDHDAAEAFCLPRQSPLTCRCKEKTYHFRTCWDAPVWPLKIADVKVGGNPRHLRVELERTSGRPVKETWGLRLYLAGPIGDRNHQTENLDRARELYQAIFLAKEVKAEVQVNGAKTSIGVRPMGFDPDDAVLPLPPPVVWPQQMLLEYFVFPKKFLFIELQGFGSLLGQGGATLKIPLADAWHGRPETLKQLVRLNCVPLVNCFREDSVQRQDVWRRREWQITPESDGCTPKEVYSVNRIHHRYGDREIEHVVNYRGLAERPNAPQWKFTEEGSPRHRGIVWGRSRQRGRSRRRGLCPVGVVGDRTARR